MTTDRTLLADYVANGSEDAFREVVRRYINLAYSVAFRLADSDPQMAEDIVQMVFADLARLAGTLPQEVALGGWLHRRTCHVAASTLRGERRRRNRERQAADMSADSDHTEPIYERMAPLLDDAINQLSAKDRTAIVLRFFENRDLRSIGAVLGSNEDAARKRVARALEKLRRVLGRRAVSASAAGLAAALTGRAVTAAPAALAADVSTVALAGAAKGGGLTLTLLKLLATTKIKVAAGVVLAAGIGASLVLEYQALARLRDQNQALQLRIAQMSSQADQAQAPSKPVVGASAPGAEAQGRLQELNRLRGEVGALRTQTGQIARLRADNRKLSQAIGEPEDPAEAVFQRETQHRRQEMQPWLLGFVMYAAGQWGSDHSTDRFPESWQDAAGTIPASQREAALTFASDHFEIVYRGPAGQSNTNDLPRRAETILIREKQARRSPSGEWVKLYGFADGHVGSHSEADDNFDAWERTHLTQFQ
jgi:RNA polymerase sigma factor (sigma-70 family)